MKRFSNTLISRLSTHGLPLLVLLFATLLVYRRMVFSNLILARGDTFLYFYPYWEAAADALREGRLPLWNPDLFMGAPLLANSQIGFFYPLNWPVWLLFETPYAISASIVIHVFIAAVGTYIAARRALKLSRMAAVVAALMFALGGYLSAQVEHINQAQGLAWMPWLIAAASNWQAVSKEWRHVARRLLLVALFFTLQLLAGHTQSTFITGIGVVLWAGSQLLGGVIASAEATPQPIVQRTIRPLLSAGVALGAGVVLAVVLAGVQLLPTLELTGLSRRQGGLPIDEALSFSLHPLLFARALLPGYGQIPYSEYIAWLPITGLVLALIGLSRTFVASDKRWRYWAPLALVVVGIFLAFGKFNPLVRDYVMRLPGFALFRVPARWMVLYSLGASFFAGVGWDALAMRHSEGEGRSKSVGLGALFALIPVLILMAAVPYSAELGINGGVPMPPESPAQVPRFTLWIGWLAELTIILVVLLSVVQWKRRWTQHLLWLPLLFGLVWAQRTQAWEALTTPEAYFDVRASVARLMVSAEDARANSQPIPRFLSISQGFFDPGDQAELDTIYTDQLSAEAQYRYTVSIKEREIVVPNLTLSFGLSAVDGFDGGLLPLGDYASTVGLMLPDGVTTVDGRLREFLPGIPDARWLDLFGVRHLITDRTGDNWFAFEDDNVFFDLQQRITLQPGETLDIGWLPPYASSELWIVSEGSGSVIMRHGDNEEVIVAEALTDVLYTARWSNLLQPDSIQLVADQGEWVIVGASLVDTLHNTFRQTALGNYRLAHAGDVKIYENLDVIPRAFVVHNWMYAGSIDEAVGMMASAEFDPRTHAIVEGAGEAAVSDAAVTPVAVTHYASDNITLETTLEEAGLLVLTEAIYPDWHVTVNGESAELQRVDAMFRGVFLDAGTHEIIFTYAPQSLRNGFMVTGVGLLLGVGVLTAIVWRRPAAESEAVSGP